MRFKRAARSVSVSILLAGVGFGLAEWGARAYLRHEPTEGIWRRSRGFLTIPGGRLLGDELAQMIQLRRDYRRFPVIGYLHTGSAESSNEMPPPDFPDHCVGGVASSDSGAGIAIVGSELAAKVGARLKTRPEVRKILRQNIPALASTPVEFIVLAQPGLPPLASFAALSYCLPRLRAVIRIEAAPPTSEVRNRTTGWPSVVANEYNDGAPTGISALLYPSDPWLAERIGVLEGLNAVAQAIDRSASALPGLKHSALLAWFSSAVRGLLARRFGTLSAGLHGDSPQSAPAADWEKTATRFLKMERAVLRARGVPEFVFVDSSAQKLIAPLRGLVEISELGDTRLLTLDGIGDRVLHSLIARRDRWAEQAKP